MIIRTHRTVKKDSLDYKYLQVGTRTIVILCVHL